MLKMPETWNTCRGKPQIISGASLREATWVANSKAVEGEVTKSLGAHIIVTA
jgi:hypothetical protein